MAHFQEEEIQHKLLSFYSAFVLSYGYIWSTVGTDHTYYKLKTATDIVYYGYRILLQENQVFFPSHRRLTETIASLKNKPDQITQKAETFLNKLDHESKDDFVNSIIEHMKYEPPKDFAEILTRYVDDNQHWWYTNAPNLLEL